VSILPITVQMSIVGNPSFLNIDILCKVLLTTTNKLRNKITTNIITYETQVMNKSELSISARSSPS
jgi:hypothetical protein